MLLLSLGIGCCILASFFGFCFPSESIGTKDMKGVLPTKITSSKQPDTPIHVLRPTNTGSSTAMKGHNSHTTRISTKKTTSTKQLYTPTQTKAELKPSPKVDSTFSAPVNNSVKGNDISGCPAAVPSVSDPRNCCTTEIELQEIVEGKQCTTILRVTNSSGKMCKWSNDSLKSELVSEITNARETCTVKALGKNQYEISYLPTIKGRHQLFITVDGLDIMGSPFNVRVMKSPDKELGDPILTIAGVDRPWGIAITKVGELVVSESGKNRVSIFSPSGKRLLSFGAYGSGNGKFSSLRGVAVDNTGNILVVDKFNFRIQKFTAEGAFIRSVGTNGMGVIISKQFFLSSDVTSSNTKVYVVDVSNHHVQTLDPDLISLHSFKKGSDMRQYTHPLGVSHSRTGEVYVTSFDYHEVLVFTADGKFVNRFGKDKKYPGLKGVMDWPNGIVVDGDGIVYVCENKSNRVSMYTSDGHLLSTFGRYGEDPGEFDHPRGIAVDSCGVLYVCDYDNNRIQVF